MRDNQTVAPPRLPPGLKTMLLPGVALKIALGARHTVSGETALVEFEGHGTEMHREDLEIAIRVSRRLSSQLGRSVTPGVLIEACELSRKFVSEEIFAPGTVRVLYYPVVAQGSAFYRCIQPALAMNSLGTRVRAYVTAQRIAREALDYDVVVFQIDHSPWTIQFAKTLKSMGKKIVYELDDAYDALEPWHAGGKQYAKPAERALVNEMMGIADALVVSTEGLRDRYAGRARRIEVMPNYIVTADFPRRRDNETGKFRILWAGSPSHAGDIDVAIPGLLKFRELHPDTTLVFFGMKPQGLDVEYHEWTAFERYPATLADLAADVAIAPLADVPFNQGKSDVKLLEMGACGYPVVASDVGPYRAARGHGVSLCGSTQHWVDALELCRRSPEARSVMAEELAKYVERRDLGSNARAIEEFFVSLAK